LISQGFYSIAIAGMHLPMAYRPALTAAMLHNTFQTQLLHCLLRNTLI